MKTRPLFVLAVLLLLLAGLKFMQSRRHDERVGRSGLEQLFPEVATDRVGKLVITGPAGTELLLQRSGADWRVESRYGHPAANDKVEGLLGELTGLLGEYRSDDEAVLVDYSLNEGSALHLRAYDLAGVELGHLLLGGRRTGAAGFFARRDGEQKAYAARGGLLGSLGVWGEEREPKAKTFLDLKAFEVDRQQVDRIHVMNEADRLELVKAFAPPPPDTLAVDRGDYEWRAGDTALDKAKVDGVLGALASVWARDLLDPAADYGFNEASRRAELHLADGSSAVLEFGATVNEPEAGVAMRVYGDKAVYLVYDRLPERIFKSREELVPDAE